MQNKKSVWSTLLLIATFLMMASAIISIVTVIVGLPAVMEAAKEIAREEAAAMGTSISEEYLDIAMNAAKTMAITILVFVLAIAALEIVGGFLFSLKGKWGVFCIVVGVLGVLGGLGNLFSINAKTEPGTVVSYITSFLISAVFLTASIAHYVENKKLREEETI